jgi:hypothetical protein
MILPAALLLGTQLTIPVVDSVPALNVEQVCKGIAQQGGVTFHDPQIAQELKNCLESEQAMRDQLEKQWSSFQPADRTACTNESTMGGESSYTELLTCLEMARDVRAMQEPADSSENVESPDNPRPAPKPKSKR